MEGPKGSKRSIDDVTSYLIRKLRNFYALTSSLEKDIADLSRELVTFPAGSKIIARGDPYDTVLLQEHGWVLRSKDLDDGSRQIVNVAMAGDFLCFNALLFREAEFDLVAKTDVGAFRLAIPSLNHLFSQHQGLAAALTWANAHEESLLAERIVSLGRRDARARLAHVLCELKARRALMGEEGDQVLELPLTQDDLADILGISVIHVNRTFRSLVNDGVLTYSKGLVRILDQAALSRISGFEGSYLHFTQRHDFRK